MRPDSPEGLKATKNSALNIICGGAHLHCFSFPLLSLYPLGRPGLGLGLGPGDWVLSSSCSHLVAKVFSRQES